MSATLAEDLAYWEERDQTYMGSKMQSSTKIVIFGHGQIGTACGKFIYDLFYNKLGPAATDVYEIWDKAAPAGVHRVDIDQLSVMEIAGLLVAVKATHVIVAMPFQYNEKIAQAACHAECHYIDFTEDDLMADKVQAIYKDSGLTCAVKCGLAPGFINYLGHSLVRDIVGEVPAGAAGTCSDLMISVGALPRNVNGSNPRDWYNLSWSVDGLVNEYIRPCRVRIRGQEIEIPALTGKERVLADGNKYEARYTSGGVGSLVKELKHVQNVAYKTLRYPGHYDYVVDAVNRHRSDFSGIKSEFLRTFPFNPDDVIVVYAEAKGVDANNTYIRRSYSSHFVGVDGLSAIQSTTAGSGVAVLELMLDQQIFGIINHADISLEMISQTFTFKSSYKKK
jgi:saccharopine dehydrogenase-like NADP-dependent oxidoreductase